MLGDSKLKTFLDLINTSTKDELIWINGYLNAIVQGKILSASPVAVAEAAAPAVNKITIVLETELNCNTIIIVSPAKAKNKAYIKKL